MTGSVSTALLSLLAIDSAVQAVEPKVPLFLDKLTFTILYYLLQRAGNHARIAHRAKINVFDVLRALLSLNYTPAELKGFLLWCRFQSQKQHAGDVEIFRDFGQNCELKLEFAPIPANPADFGRKAANAPVQQLANLAGCEFYPPIPPAFTYKFTPIYGKREDDVVAVMKRQAEEKILVERNLFSTLQRRSKAEHLTVNYDDI